MDLVPYTRYLAVFAATFIGVIALVWAYTAAFPVAFMETGYAAWTAKSAMLRECRIGQIAFFGDSRLEAGVVPSSLPVPAANFGLSAGTAVETRIAVDRALACPEPPRQVVISLVPEHFGPLSRYYWLLSLRYGFVSASDARSVARRAAQLGDAASLAADTPDGLGGPLRDWLYAVGFPSFSFSSLVQGQIFGRYGGNVARIAAIRADGGWTAYPPATPIRPDHPDRFILTRLQAAELEDTLATLKARGIETALLVMPFASDHEETEAMLLAYRDYLASLAQRHGAILLDPVVPIWPVRFFADGAHLDGAGARAFTARLAACRVDGRFSLPCDLGPPADSAILEMKQ